MKPMSDASKKFLFREPSKRSSAPSTAPSPTPLRSKEYVRRGTKQRLAPGKGHLTYSLRMTAEEWLLLEYRAKFAGVSKAEFIRSKLR